jgi:hypothetical protein
MKRNNSKKRNSKQIVVQKVPKTWLFDYTPFWVRNTSNGTMFTNTTAYLGRYQTLHPSYGIGSSSPSAQYGWRNMICDPAGSTSVGLYYGAYILKVKITVEVENKESVPVTYSITQIPFNMIGLVTNDQATNFISVCSRKKTLSSAGNAGSKAQLTCIVDIPQMNGLSKQGYLASTGFMATRDTVGTNYTRVYHQALRYDTGNFASGVDLVINCEYLAHPTMKNIILIN